MMRSHGWTVLLLAALLPGSPSRAQEQQAGDEASMASEEQDVQVVAGCWSGLAALGQGLSFAGFPDAVAMALAAEDQRLLTFLRERLTELVGADVEKARQVLTWARAADDHIVVALYAEALSLSDAVHDPALREDLLALAERHDDPEHQAAAIAILETQKQLDDASLERLVRVAQETPDEANARYAVGTLGTVMETDCRASGDCQRYMDAILDIGEASGDVVTQRLAVEQIAGLQGPVPGPVVDRLAETLTSSPATWTRQLAALALAYSGDPAQTLEVYRQAFYAEVDFCTRVSIFRDAAAAAGSRALPLMAEFATLEPQLQDDYLLFKELFDAGVVAFDRVVYALFDRIHIECTMAQEAGG